MGRLLRGRKKGRKSVRHKAKDRELEWIDFDRDYESEEYDEEEEFIIKNPDGSFVFEGLTPLKEVEGALEIAFEEEDLDMYDTLNGFLISRLNRIPKDGESLRVEFADYEFRILKVKNKMIQSVRVSPLGKRGLRGMDREKEQ